MLVAADTSRKLGRECVSVGAVAPTDTHSRPNNALRCFSEGGLRAGLAGGVCQSVRWLRQTHTPVQTPPSDVFFRNVSTVRKLRIKYPCNKKACSLLVVSVTAPLRSLYIVCPTACSLLPTLRAGLAVSVCVSVRWLRHTHTPVQTPPSDVLVREDFGRAWPCVCVSRCGGSGRHTHTSKHRPQMFSFGTFQQSGSFIALCKRGTKEKQQKNHDDIV